MSDFRNPTAEFKFSALGKDSIMKPTEYYLLDRKDGTDPIPVLRHDALQREADARGVRVESCVLEHAVWINPMNFHFVHRAFGKDQSGNSIEEVGEATPRSVQHSTVGQTYPCLMSDKRAKDRLLIRAMGLQGKVYSDVEFDELNGSVEQSSPSTKGGADGESARKPKASESAEADKSPGTDSGSRPSTKRIDTKQDAAKPTAAPPKDGGQKPVEAKPENAETSSDAHELTLEEAAKMPVKYGKYDGSLTMKEFREQHLSDFCWLAYTYRPGKTPNENMLRLRRAALLLDNGEHAPKSQ